MTPTGTRRGLSVPHVAREDPDAPGCCVTCRRPLWTSRNGKQVAAPNPNHVDHPADIPPAARGPQDWAAGDRED